MRKLFDLSLQHKSLTFSLMFETDPSYAIKPDSYQLCLAHIRNHEALAFSEASRLLRSARSRSGKRPVAQALSHLEALVRTQAGRSSSFTDPKASMKAKDLIQDLLLIFNTYSEKRLLEAGIAMPPPSRSASGSHIVKFNGSVRNYQVLLAQRQLDRFLRGKEPMSRAEMEQHVANCGPYVEGSSAFQVISTAEYLRANDPSAVVRLDSQGGLDSLQKSDGSVSPLISLDRNEGKGD
jgi:hypothetical protein